MSLIYISSVFWLAGFRVFLVDVTDTMTLSRERWICMAHVYFDLPFSEELVIRMLCNAVQGYSGM